VGCCFTPAQVRYAAHVEFPVDFDSGDCVQLVTDPVIMQANEEEGCNSDSESLEKHVPRDICIVMFEDVINVSLLQKGQNNRIKNIVSVFYGI
jgi:hypothetical protein